MGTAFINTLLKETEEERENEEEEDISSYWRNLRSEKILETERENTISPYVENPLWKWLWTCRKTDYIIIMFLHHNQRTSP